MQDTYFGYNIYEDKYYGYNIYEYSIMGLKILIMVVAAELYLLTQRFINHTNSSNKFEDRTFLLTGKIHNFLTNNRNVTRMLLASTSFIIDISYGLIILDFVMNNKYDEIVINVLTLIIRQFCQYFISFPRPKDMLWFHPGFYSFCIPYDIINDFYFSGHTSFAVICLMFSQRHGYSWLGYMNLTYQIFSLIVTRSHYFPDIVTGVLVPYYVKYMLM
jgi:hypothetical protein